MYLAGYINYGLEVNATCARYIYLVVKKSPLERWHFSLGFGGMSGLRVSFSRPCLLDTVFIIFSESGWVVFNRPRVRVEHKKDGDFCSIK